MISQNKTKIEKHITQGKESHRYICLVVKHLLASWTISSISLAESLGCYTTYSKASFVTMNLQSHGSDVTFAWVYAANFFPTSGAPLQGFGSKMN